MAVGKTTVGKRIATKLNLPFYDSDKEIEINTNISVSSFFETYGEEKFRLIEEKVILDHVYSKTNKGFVMSLGGGSFINRKIREAILDKGISVWLNANIDIINLRVHNKRNTRPLLKELDTKEKLISLMQKRSKFYSKANIKVNIINGSKEKMSEMILKKIYNYLNINYE